MTSNMSLRHVMTFVKDILGDGDSKDMMRRGLEAMLATLMEVEVTEEIGAEHSQHSTTRTNQRNGYRSRQFQTGLGTSSLRIPKIRKGSYFPSFLAAYKRSDDALLAAVAMCYLQGVSTRNVQQVASALGVEHMKKSQVSAICARLDPMVDAFQNRELGEFPYLILDARYENVRENGHIHKVAVLVALGVRRDGMREVLGLAVERVENEAYWDAFINSLRDRGLKGVKLVVSDAHEGLRRAIEKRLPSAKWQRCRVHFMRNLSQRLPKKKRLAIVALAKTIFAEESLEDAKTQRREVVTIIRNAGYEDAADFLAETNEVLTYMEFPKDHWTKLHSTNLIERLNRELKRRTRVVSIFPNRAALVRLAGALLLEEHEEWLVGRRFIAEHSMATLYSPAEQLGLVDLSASLPGMVEEL